jgi:hypothetical protein
MYRRSPAAENRLRQKSDFTWPIKLIWVVQTCARKYSYFVFSEIVID